MRICFQPTTATICWTDSVLPVDKNAYGRWNELHGAFTNCIHGIMP